MDGEMQVSGKVTFLVVGSVFLAVTVGMGALAIHLYRIHAKATAMAACTVFSWAFGSMVIAMTLVVLTSGRKTKGKIGTRRGQVTIGIGNRSAGSKGHITGKGVEAAGEADVPITSVIPSLFLIISSTGLAIFGLILLSLHRLDLIGAGMFAMVVFFIANWSRLAWPRK